MDVAIYLRKSRSDPDDESIEETLYRHKSILLKFAKTNKLTILKIYEEVVSGDGLFVRPEMIKLLSDIELDRYDGVLCMDIDRLGRVDTKDRGIILDTFKSHNTQIVTPRKVYNLNDELDEFSTEIQMLFARQELKKITQRLQQGVRKTVEDGYHVGEPPYGYRRTYVNKRPTLQIYEPEAEVIRRIFYMYVNEGIGSHIIADTINDMGYKTRKNTKFSRNTIRFLLQNPIYIGKIVWNKRKHIKKKNLLDKHRSELNPESEWIVSDGVHEPIIDEEMFNAAQKIRKTRSHPPSNTGEVKNQFAGLIRCMNCGQLMSRQTSKKTGPRILCTNNGCNKSVVLSKVDNVVYNQLKTALDEFRLEVQLSNRDKKNKDAESVLNDISALKKQLLVNISQKERLHDFLEQGIYDIDTFTHRANVLNDTINAVTGRIEKLERKYATITKIPVIEKIIPTLEKVVSGYETLSAQEKNSMLKQILEAIYYKRENIGKANDFEVILKFKTWL